MSNSIPRRHRHASPKSPNTPALHIRTFTTGANRDGEAGKYDYEGFLSPTVIEAYGCYMNFNRHLIDGSTRDSDNWQKGIPMPVYVKSLWRHVHELWKLYRMTGTQNGVAWACCAIMFNVMGFLHEYLKAHPGVIQADLQHAIDAREKLWAAKRASE